MVLLQMLFLKLLTTYNQVTKYSHMNRTWLYIKVNISSLFFYPIHNFHFQPSHSLRKTRNSQFLIED